MSTELDTRTSPGLNFETVGVGASRPIHASGNPLVVDVENTIARGHPDMTRRIDKLTLVQFGGSAHSGYVFHRVGDGTVGDFDISVSTWNTVFLFATMTYPGGDPVIIRGDAVQFRDGDTGALPSGISADTTYYGSPTTIGAVTTNIYSSLIGAVARDISLLVNPGGAGTAPMAMALVDQHDYRIYQWSSVAGNTTLELPTPIYLTGGDQSLIVVPTTVSSTVHATVNYVEY